jgi:hypothetical protein
MKAGKYRIKWHHAFIDESVPNISAGHYLTSCELEGEQNSDWAYAICSKGDNFNKDTGRKLSLARVLKNANIPKEERKSIWEAYRTMTVKPRW